MLPLSKLRNYIIKKHKTQINNCGLFHEIYKTRHYTYVIQYNTHYIKYTFDLIDSTFKISISRLNYKICYQFNKSRSKINKIIETKNNREIEWNTDPLAIYKIQLLETDVGLPDKSYLEKNETICSIDIRQSKFYSNGRITAYVITCLKNFKPSNYSKLFTGNVWKINIVYSKRGIDQIMMMIHKTNKIKVYQRI